MNLCSDNHDEVCYEGRQCPCCHKMQEAKQELAEKEQKIDSLQEKITDLESQIAENS